MPSALTSAVTVLFGEAEFKNSGSSQSFMETSTAGAIVLFKEGKVSSSVVMVVVVAGEVAEGGNEVEPKLLLKLIGKLSDILSVCFSPCSSMV